MNIKICLDAGHSSKFKGASANGLNEEEVVLKIALKVGEKLESKGVKVFYTRKNGKPMNDVNNSQDLGARYKYANSNRVDYFVSIHNNKVGYDTANGIETLYNTRFAKSKTLADDIQNQLISDTGMKNRGLKLRTDLAILNGTQMPTCLVEVGFISNPNDASKIKDSSFLDTVAKSITKGICKTCGISYEEDKKDEELEKAINLLESKNIILQKEHWDSTSVMNLDNVPFLLDKLGGIEYLVNKGIIGDVELWTTGAYKEAHVRMLIIKCSKMLDVNISSPDNKDKVKNCIDLISRYAISNYKNSKVLPSLVIAQACWESGYLTSELAVKANNPFGMKYNDKISTVGSYSYKGGKWCMFKSLGDAVVQQGKFYNLYNRYSGIVGEIDIDKALEELEKSGYCEGSGYSNNIRKMINQYDLLEYDKQVLIREYDVIDISMDKGYQKAIEEFYNVGIITQDSWRIAITTRDTEALLKKTGNYMYGAKTYSEAIECMKKDLILTSEIWDGIDNVKATHLRSFIIKVSKIL